MTITQIRVLLDKYRPAFLGFLLSCFYFSGQGQTYAPSVCCSVSNKAFGAAQSVSTDGRSWFYDATNFVMRDYNGTTEVFSYLNLPKYRSGHFPIFVHSGGILQGNGVWLGGSSLVYWFKDSTGNANLVRWYTDSTGLPGGPFYAVANNLSEGNAGLIKDNLTLDLVNNTSDAQKNAASVFLTNHTIDANNNTLLHIPNSALTNNAIGLSATSAAGSDIAVTSTPASLGSNLIINFPSAGTATRGPLTSTDWNIFNNKQSTITLTVAGTSGPATLVGPVLNIPTYIPSPICDNCNADSIKHLPVDTTSNRNGYILAFDSISHKWYLTPNAGSGAGITQLTNDVTAGPGSGSQVATLATVNSNVGTFGSASTVYQGTVNGKGLTTAAVPIAIQIAESQVTNLNADLALKLSTSLTSGNMFVGNGSNIATGVTPSGDWTTNNAGVNAIGSNKVTYAKFQASSQQALLGATGAGNFGEITLGSNLSMSGSVLNVFGTSQTLDQTLKLGNKTNEKIIDSNNIYADTSQPRSAWIHGPLRVGDSTVGAPVLQIVANGASVILGIGATPSTVFNGNIGVSCAWFNFVQTNVAQSSTSTCQYNVNDSSTFSRIHEATIYDPANCAYYIFNTGDADTSTSQAFWNQQLGAIIDTLHVNKGWPLNRIIVLTPIWRINPVSAAFYQRYCVWDSLLCATKGVKYGNIFTPLQLNYPGSIYSDSLHPSTFGHLLIAHVENGLMREFPMVGNALIQQNIVIGGNDSTYGNNYTAGIITPAGGFQQAVNDKLIKVRPGTFVTQTDLGGFEFKESGNSDSVQLAISSTGTNKSVFQISDNRVPFFQHNPQSNFTEVAGGAVLIGTQTNVTPFPHQIQLVNGGNTLSSTKIGMGVDGGFRLKIFGSSAVGYNSLGTLDRDDTLTFIDMLSWTSDGNVGIGMTNPGRKLQVNGNAQINSGLRIIGDAIHDDHMWLITNGGNSPSSTKQGIGTDASYRMQIFGSYAVPRHSLGILGSDSITYTPVINWTTAFHALIGTTTDNVGWLQIGANTSSTPSLLFNAGTPATTKTSGAVNFNNGLLMFDSSSSVRDTFAMRSWVRNYLSNGGSNNIYNIDGVLSGDRILSGANHNLTLGVNSSSPIGTLTADATLLTLQAEGSMGTFMQMADAVTTFNNTAIHIGAGIPSETDANVTVLSTGLNILLPVITSNRTVTMPTASSNSGRILTLTNANTAGFTWSFSGTNVKDIYGNTLTTIPNGSMYSLAADQPSGTWIAYNIQQNYNSTVRYAHSIFAPTTGGTVNLVTNQYNIINPAGALLALTVNLPSNPVNNDVVYIKYTQTISTVTYANGNVVDGITAPTAGGLTVLTYDAGTTSWY